MRLSGHQILQLGPKNPFLSPTSEQGDSPSATAWSALPLLHPRPLSLCAHPSLLAHPFPGQLMSLAERSWVMWGPWNELPPTLPRVQAGSHRSAFVPWHGAEMLRG